MAERRRVAPRTTSRAGRVHTIGEAAAASSVSAKMIRYYEREGLIPPAVRTASNYRTYTDADVHTLRFVRRARKLGFSMPQLRVLLALWQDRGRSSAQVKKLALAHVAELDGRIAELAAMRDSLHELAHACAGDDRPDCPILRDLAGTASGNGVRHRGRARTD